MEIALANEADRGALMALLAAADLPTSDLTTASLRRFLVMREQGQIVGTVGFDSANGIALLRSLAVRSQARGRGHGKALVVAAENFARECGISRLYLLTTTADKFFESHGYSRVSRDQAPDSIRVMPQFAGLCPSTSTFMSKAL